MEGKSRNAPVLAPPALVLEGNSRLAPVLAPVAPPALVLEGNMRLVPVLAPVTPPALVLEGDIIVLLPLSVCSLEDMLHCVFLSLLQPSLQYSYIE